MADRITSIYEKACAKGILDPQTQSEQWFRDQLSTEQGVKSFYDHATANGMKFHPYPEFKERLSQPVSSQPSSAPSVPKSGVSGGSLLDEQSELARQNAYQGATNDPNQPFVGQEPRVSVPRQANLVQQAINKMATTPTPHVEMDENGLPQYTTTPLPVPTQESIDADRREQKSWFTNFKEDIGRNWGTKEGLKQLARTIPSKFAASTVRFMNGLFAGAQQLSAGTMVGSQFGGVYQVPTLDEQYAAYRRVQNGSKDPKDIENSSAVRLIEQGKAIQERLSEKGNPINLGEDEDFVSLAKQGKISSFMRYGLGTAVESGMDNLLALTPLGRVALASSIAGNRFHEKSIENMDDVPLWARAVSAVGEGAIAQFVESRYNPFHVLDGLGKGGVKGVLHDIEEQAGKNMYKWIAKQLGKATLEEGGEEITENVLDDLMNNGLDLILNKMLDLDTGKNGLGWQAEYENFRKQNKGMSDDEAMRAFAGEKAHQYLNDFIGGALGGLFMGGGRMAMGGRSIAQTAKDYSDLGTAMQDVADEMGVTIQDIAKVYDEQATMTPEQIEGRPDFRELNERLREAMIRRQRGIVNSPEEQQEAEVQQDRQTQLRQQAAQQAQQEVQGMAHQDGNVYYVGIKGKDDAEGYAVSGNLNMQQDDKGMYGTRGRDLVTVKMNDGSVQQVPADELVVRDIPVSADELMQERIDHYFAQYANNDLFHVGDKVYLKQNGQQSEDSSTIVNITDEGVEVEIIDPNGQPNTTVIPHEQAAEMLSKAEGTEDGIVTYVLPDNTQLRLRKTGDGVYEDITPDGTGTIHTEDDLANMGAIRQTEALGASQIEGLGSSQIEEQVPAYPTDETGNPAWGQMEVPQSAQVLYDLYQGNRKSANAYADDQLKEAQKVQKEAAKQASHNLNIAQRLAEEEQNKQFKAQADAAVKYWENVKLAIAQIKTAEELAAEQAQRDKLMQAREQNRKTEEGTTANATMAERYNAAPKIIGSAGTTTLPDGRELAGHYVLIAPEGVTASHNAADNFRRSEGYPVTADGQSINDRDYTADQEEQQKVVSIAQNFNGNAIKNMPVISDEGLVYNGNGRMMAGQLAAINGTDAAYMESLTKNAAMYGFTPEQVASIPHARIAFQLDERLPYSTQSLAIFNEQETQTQSNTGKAAGYARKLTPQAISEVLAAVDGFNTIDAFFNDRKAPFELINRLITEGIIAQRERAEMVNNDKLSDTGRERLSNILFGTAFSNETIRLIGDDAALKNSVMRALPQILDNKSLGEFSLESDINDAIRLLYEVRRAGVPFQSFVRQTVMSEDGEVHTAAENYSPYQLLLAEEMTDGGVDAFRDVLNLYNEQAKTIQGGQVDIFGDLLTPTELKNLILQRYGKEPTETERPSAGRQTDNAPASAPASNEPAAEQTITLTDGRVVTPATIKREDFALLGNISPIQRALIAILANKAQHPDWELSTAGFGNDARGLLFDELPDKKSDLKKVEDIYQQTQEEYLAEPNKTAEYRLAADDVLREIWRRLNYLDSNKWSGGQGAALISRLPDAETPAESTPEERLAQAEAETDTNPTEAQKKVENYKQGHVTLWGLPISIENPKGSIRRGTDANGKKWEQEMHHTYGKIRRTEGVDGDHIDVFIGPNLTSNKVFVVDQRNVDTGEFDEHKVMLGFDSLDDAQNGYLSNYEEGWQGMGTVTEVTMDEFKKWIDSSHRKTKPFAEYKSVKTEGAASAAMQTDERLRDELAVELRKFDYEVQSPSDANVRYDIDDLRNAVKDILTRYNNPALQAAMDAINTSLADQRERRVEWVDVEKEEDALVQIIRDIVGDKAAPIPKTPRVSVGTTPLTRMSKDEILNELQRYAAGNLFDMSPRMAKRIISLAKKYGKGLPEEFENMASNAKYMTDLVNGKVNVQTPSTPTEIQEENITPLEAAQKRKAAREAAKTAEQKNTIFTDEAYEAAKARMKARLNRLNMGIDPEMVADQIVIAGYHVERGARKFADFARALIADFGDGIRQYARQMYNFLRDIPQGEPFRAEMDDYTTVMAFDIDNFDKNAQKSEENAENILINQNNLVTLQPNEKEYAADGLSVVVNTQDYTTYLTPQAKEVFAKLGQKERKPHKRPELSYISFASRDGVMIPLEVLKSDPAIIEAQAKIDSNSGSLELTQEQIEEYANRLLEGGDIKSERKAFIIIGRPAGGKSSVFAEPLAEQNSARIIDSDEVKPWLDGYDNGDGAGYVQKASDRVMQEALWRAALNGENVVIPKIGGGSIIDEIALPLKELGYTVELYYNEVAPESSYMRAMARFAEKGRYLSLNYLADIGDKPTKTFNNYSTKDIYGTISELSSQKVQDLRARLARIREMETRLLPERLGRGGRSISTLGISELLESGELGRGRDSQLAGTPLFDHYEWKNNDVPFGTKPKTIKQGDNVNSNNDNGSNEENSGRVPQTPRGISRSAEGQRDRLGEGDSVPSAVALGELLKDKSAEEQHKLASEWAKEHGILVDFPKYASENGLSVFANGNENDNWVDTQANVVYKMNNLMNSADKIANLIERVELYNEIFPETKLSLWGFSRIYGSKRVHPIYTQQFIDNAEHATQEQIDDLMRSKGFEPTGNREGEYSNGQYIVSDALPKNAMRTNSGIVFVIDADVKRAGQGGGGKKTTFEKGQKVKYKNKVDGKLYDATIDSVNADGTYNLLAPNPVFGDVFMGNISEDRISPIEQPKTEQQESPIQRQFKAIKEQYPDAVLLFRVGDFYELYDTDAEEGSKILGITLTRTTWAKMAGFPFHALDIYLPKLVRAGKRVAICDQLENPKEAKKEVKRGVTELVETPKVESAEVAEPESVTDNQEPTIPEPQQVVTDTVGEITESKHTKTGAPIWVVKPMERVGDAEFRALRKRAKENNGYYSTFVKGYVFNSVNDANRFNNISDVQTTTEQGRADSEAAISTAETAIAEAEAIRRDSGDTSGAAGELGGESVETGVSGSRDVELTQEQAAEQTQERKDAIQKIDEATERIDKQLAELTDQAEEETPEEEPAPTSMSEVVEQAKKRQQKAKQRKQKLEQTLDLFAEAEDSTPALDEQTEPINTEDNGRTEVRNDGQRKGRTQKAGSAGQPADQNGTLGGSQRQTDEGTQSGGVGSSSEQYRVHDGERGLGTAGQPSAQDVERRYQQYVEDFKDKPSLPEYNDSAKLAADVRTLEDLIRMGINSASTQAELKFKRERLKALESQVPESERKNTHNFRYDPNDPAPTSNKARYEANLAAIRLLKQLQDEGRQATPEEQRVLAKFTGWGGLGEYFKGEPGTTYWSDHGEKSPYQVIKELLTDEEMQAAQLSRNSAYFTPPAIIEELWNVAKHLGFKGGNILEGSAGIGNILSQMPQSISDRSNLQAVEIDSITAGILAQLYPDAQVHAAGFQEVDIPNNSQDLVITNVPFVTGLRVYDKKEKDLSKRFGNIHDFCIAKNVRKLRQGGIGIFITSSGTLDSSKDLRRWLNNEGETDVIAAFRLNRETFGGTSATSDIIVVRKRVNGQKDPRAIDVLDTEVARVATPEPEQIWDRKTNSWVNDTPEEKKLIYNRYFVEHPESMGGEMGFGFEHGDTRWGGTTSGCYPSPAINQSERLQEWVEAIPTTGDVQTVTVRESNNFNPGTYEEYHGDLPYGSLVLNSKDEICRVYNGMVVPVDGINPTKVKGHTKAEVLKDYNTLKAAVEELLAEQAKGISDEGLKGLLKKLNRAYDDFVKKYGNLNRNVSLSFLRNDVQWASMAALENVRETIDKNGKKQVEVSKTDVFSKRVVGVQAEPKAENARDGVILSVQQYGNVRPDMIAMWLQRPQEDVEKEIIESRLAFRDPQTGNMVVSHEYLSGNVREKLAYAEEHNENGIYDTNIEELRKVIPVDIPAHLIEFNIGSTWIPVELYHKYLKEKFGVENLRLVHVGSAWISNEQSYGGYALRNEKNRAEGVYSEILMEQVYGHQLMIAAMNNVPVVVSKTEKHRDGTTETITDKAATAACSDKISQIKDDFVEWARGKMQEDSELAELVQKIYNERFNAIVPMLSVDKAFLSPHLPGQNHKYTLYDHQQQAVVRATTQPVMLAHEVGTGKTITLISSAMEMRRLGTAKKPMIVVQNATTPQFVKEAKDLYPNAKILTVSERDRTKEGRQEFYAKIKYNDWDLIIVPQSVFDMIPDSESRMRDFIQEKIDEKMHAIEAAKEANVDAKVTKRMEKELEALQEDLQNANMSGKRSKSKTEKDAKKDAERIENAKARAEEMLDRRTDEVEDFDDMGIDALLIDEAHNYKHLGFATMMTRGVKGIDPSYSKRAAALYLKCQSVYERCGHRNVVFATGTPISNTAAEIWTFMKYLMPKEVLKDNDIYYFDDFVHNFGKIAEQLEFATNGKFKANNRFAQYGNVPELMRIWLTCADCVLTREVGQVNDKVPELEGGKAQDIFLPQSPSLIDIMASVRAELERYEQMSGKEKKENNHIPLTMYGVAKRAAIDPRLVDASAADEPLSKTNKAVEETLRSLKETKKYNGTVAIFCDSYRNLQTGFNLFEDIKAKLVKAGVPAAKIAIIRSEMTDAAKQKIFDAVREGEIRVIMGSTQTLGTGVNIQTRLHTLIHMDAPDRPMDYTQRNGRIIRQGNMHRQWNIPVRVLRFGVEDSLDVTSYQRLKTKAGFIDSIMNGKSMIDNNLENRVLEDVEEGIFDNPVAMLSGSQYALLKSQAERDLRKWQARKQQHDIDQILIAKKLKDNAQIIEHRRQLIATDEQFLQTLQDTFPTGKVTEYNIDGTICHNAAELKEALKAINAEIQARADKLRKEGYEGSKQNIAVSLQFNGMPFNVNIVLIYNSRWESGQRAITINKEVQYTTPTSDHWLGSPTKVLDKLVEHIEQDYLSGTQATGEINYSRSYIERLQQENELMRQREGKPFEHSAELEKAQALVDEYTEKMQDELAEKEAKYANMSSGRAVTLNEQDDEEEAPEAQITNLDYPQFANQTEAQQLATAALVEILNDNTDLDVFLATDEEASQIMGDDNVEFSIRKEAAPKKTGIGYKVFYRGKDGKLYPPMVANPNGEATPVGVWLNADAAPVAGESKTGRPQVKAGGKGTQGGSGQLAYRPGWHLGEIPYALQFNRKDENGEKTLFPKDFVWAEVEYAADNDYQEEAMREGVNSSGKFQHSLAGLKHVPTDGFYRYRTNPNPATDPWIITGAIKVNRVLTNEEVDEIVRAAGREPQRREGDVPEFSFRTDRDGNPIGDGDWHMNYFVSEFPEYPQISSRVDKSVTTESVYVTYTNADNGRSVKVRFSGHRSNAERFGDVLTGGAPRGEILYRLGLATKEWQPFGYVPIGTISNKQIAEGNYEVADKTRAELERLPKGTDISEYKGKLVPGEPNRIYTGTFVGESQSAGIYIYKDENGNEIRGGLREAMRTPNGTLYGWAIGDRIYLTKDGLNPNSPIHEYSHIWAKAMMRNNREGWQSIVDIFKGTPFWDEVVNDQNYHGLTTDDAICSEVLARYSGQRGAARMEEWAKEELYEAEQSGSLLRGAKVRQLINRAKKALADFWHWVGVNLFGIKHFDSAEQVADRVLWDMLKGTELKPEDQTTTNNFKQWFGDWQNDPEHASKVVDKKGRPLVVYHGSPYTFDIYVAFSPNQIKSATDNNGDFSEDNDNIEMMISGYTQEKQRIINEWYAAHPRPQYQVGEKLDHYLARLEQWNKEYKAFNEQLKAGMPTLPSTEKADSPTSAGAPAFVPGVRPTPLANETPYEYALRLRQYYQLMRDERLVAEYVAEINNQADAAAKVLKKNTIVRGLLDAAKPIENFQEWMKQRGATITDESNAYTDTFLATGRVTEANEQMQRDIIRPLAKQIAKIIAPDAKTGKSRLDGINIVWHNMDVAGTGSKLDGKALTPREIIGVYCQAKDCAEAIEKGLPDRGAKGFLNNLGMSHDDVIAAVESVIPRAELDELWRLINAATHFALNYDYESGRISKDTHTEFYQREFYVPQRGWRERDESGLITDYEPVGKRGNDPYNAALVKAHGRQSLASDPFAYIMSIDASSIVSSENNKIKQKFLQFCLDNENLGLQTGAFRVKKYWIMNVIDPETGKIKLDEEGNPMMEVSYVAPSAEDLSHDRTIKELIKKKRKEWAKVNQAYLERQSHGELGPQLEAAYKTKLSKIEQAIEDLEQQMHIAWNATNTNITQRTSDEKKQHEVRVLLDGQEYLIEVQDEKLANAINKKFKQHQEQLFNTTQKMRNATRFMSAVLTQYNPEFAASNFARDFQVALATLTAEHPELVGPFLKNFAACQPAVWQYAFNDKVRDRAVFRDSELGRYLQEYFKAGAATGFSYMQDLKSLRQDFDAMVNESNLRRGIKGAVGTLSMLTQVSETAVRFAGYVAARQKGMGINEAAYLSKELTTNFDRAGEVADSGWMSWFSFFRATLNGNIKFLKALKKMPLAYSLIAAAYVAMGMLNQFLNPDDPEDEVWAGDFTRESNFVIGKWRIPTAHFLRMFFASGVNAAKWMQGEKSFGEATYNTANFASQELLPNYLNLFGNGTEWNSREGKVDFTWEGLLQGVMPSPVSPIADVYFNRDFRGATINHEPFAKSQEGTKDILLSKENTLPVYKWLTQAIYEGVGGNMNTKYQSDDPAWRSWLFDTSASSVEHVVEGYMPAGMDMFITLGEAIYDAATGTPTGPDKWPFVRKFYNAYTPERAYMQQYYLLNGRVNEFKRNMDDYRKNDRTKYNILTHSQEYRNYQEAERLVKKQKENPTTADVQALINANKQWIK